LCTVSAAILNTSTTYWIQATADQNWNHSRVSASRRVPCSRKGNV
jgi:hypothetical protein